MWRLRGSRGIGCILAISKATAKDLARVLQRPGYEACVIGAPLDPVFEGGGSAERRHVLVAGGAEARKNVACALRAQARSAMMREVPVVVTGRYPAAEIAALAGAFREAGGKMPTGCALRGMFRMRNWRGFIARRSCSSARRGRRDFRCR